MAKYWTYYRGSMTKMEIEQKEWLLFFRQQETWLYTFPAMSNAHRFPQMAAFWQFLASPWNIIHSSPFAEHCFCCLPLFNAQSGVWGIKKHFMPIQLCGSRLAGLGTLFLSSHVAVNVGKCWWTFSDVLWFVYVMIYLSYLSATSLEGASFILHWRLWHLLISLALRWLTNVAQWQKTSLILVTVTSGFNS